MQELSADERAVLTMLRFQKHVLPDWLRRAEARHANGHPPNNGHSANAAEHRARWGRLFETIRNANTRVGGIIDQGRHGCIIERLTAWGLWREPNPPPPAIGKIIERLKELDEANRNPVGEAGSSAA